jgi:histidinol dehydrogenase
MQIITGFEAAKAGFTPGIPEFGKVSPRSRETFGREMSPEEVVAHILSDVITRGDEAVIDYTARFDRVTLTALEVPQAQIREACNKVNPELLASLKLAAQRIRDFHQEQKEMVWRGVNGKEWGQLVRPIEKVGLYAPAALPLWLLQSL